MWVAGIKTRGELSKQWTTHELQVNITFHCCGMYSVVSILNEIINMKYVDGIGIHFA